MVPELQIKLTDLISKTIETEAEAVYFLSCVRKILEQENLKEKYANLNFYCNWALHSKLDKSAKRIIKTFEAVHLHYCENGPDANLPSELSRQMQDIARLDLFQAELLDFLTEFDLPQLDSIKPDAWVYFMHLYARIIRDCPLVGDESYTIVKELVTNIEFAREIIHNEQCFRIVWQVTDIQGRSGSHDIYHSFFVAETA